MRRAGVLAGSEQLDVYAPITGHASGDMSVSFQAAGETLEFSTPVNAKDRNVRFRHDIRPDQASVGTGIVTMRYAGNRDTRGQEVRLRAAPGKARLEPKRPTLDDGRLEAAGTISQRARGVVRVQLDWVSGGERRSLEVNADIEDGDWRLSERLSDETRRSLEARTGSLHSYILFTGYLPARMRGEMRSFQVLGGPS
jgi:hypothetical protein